MSLSNSLDELATFKLNNTRSSQQFFDKSVPILKTNQNLHQDDNVWPVIEQLALAALDIGRLDVAKQCWKTLVDKFPDSPRVLVLQGIIMESTEPLESVLRFYEVQAKKEPHNTAFWKRQISVLRQLGRIEDAVNELRYFLDTFYSDLEGWLELADIYSSCSQYTLALQALSHALLLAPQNPFTFLQFAETAFSAGDIPLALKNFLLVTEMNDSDISAPQDQTPTGISVRAWWGVKLCARRLLWPTSSSLPESASKTPVPKSLKLIDQLATERVLTAYSGERGIHNRDLVSNWMSTN